MGEQGGWERECSTIFWLAFVKDTWEGVWFSLAVLLTFWLVILLTNELLRRCLLQISTMFFIHGGTGGMGEGGIHIFYFLILIYKGQIVRY